MQGKPERIYSTCKTSPFGRGDIDPCHFNRREKYCIQKPTEVKDSSYAGFSQKGTRFFYEERTGNLGFVKWSQKF